MKILLFFYYYLEGRHNVDTTFKVQRKYAGRVQPHLEMELGRKTEKRKIEEADRYGRID